MSPLQHAVLPLGRTHGGGDHVPLPFLLPQAPQENLLERVGMMGKMQRVLHQRRICRLEAVDQQVK